MTAEPKPAPVSEVVAERPSSWQARVATLEGRLAGRDRASWPPAWQPPDEPATARIGLAAASLVGGGFRRTTAGEADAAAHAAPSRPAGALAHRADERFPAASTMKVFVLQALLEAVAAGRHGLDEQLALGAEDGVSGSGVLKLLTPGTRLSLLDLATLMITVSDNTATNLLIDTLGIDLIRQSVVAHGWDDTHLRGKLQLAPVATVSASSPTVTSPRDLADYFSRLWAGELLPAELTEVARGIYRRQQFSELGRSLDYDSYSAEIGTSNLLIASKSGSIRGVRNDAGVFEFKASDAEADDPASPGAGDSYVVVVMTDGCPDRRFHADNLGNLVVGEVAALALAELRGG